MIDFLAANWISLIALMIGLTSISVTLGPAL
jgi:hypothetical protein